MLIAFPLQEWLHERVSLLRHTYSTLPVFFVCLFVMYIYTIQRQYYNAV